MDKKLVSSIIAAAAVTSIANAGTEYVPAPKEPVPEPHSCGDWCETLKTIGSVYSSDEGFINSLKFFGRLQVQYAYTEGESNGSDFNESFTEFRRVRFGTEVKFLNNFKLKLNANLEDGGPDDHQFAYDSLDEATLTYTSDGLFGFDKTSFSYGRHKLDFSYEATTSSKKIKTIERSNITNFFYGSARLTGLEVDASKGGWSGRLAIYSTDESDEIGNFDGGLAFFAKNSFDLGAGKLHVDAIYNDVSDEDRAENNDEVGYEWAVSAAYTTKLGSWDLLVNGLYGETHDNGAVYGLVIMPSTWLVEDKLEFVARYQYAGSDEDQLRLSSRYSRRGAESVDASFNGDENHTLYAGLNWYLCDHNSKFQFGIEYETLDGGDNGADADATTISAAYRTYF